MASGKVKWFNNALGFGFIAQEAGKDIFVHHTAIQGKGYKTLQEGEVVNYEVIESDKGPKAENVQRTQPEGEASAPSPAGYDQQRSANLRFQNRPSRPSGNRPGPRRAGF
ncbi:MAG: cold-shock DNA-binding domain protein [Verrucomicrobiales bacterium]|nr:cold-shock DNA-binding domain protein [Verrucomicrobiales bacterium]